MSTVKTAKVVKASPRKVLATGSNVIQMKGTLLRKAQAQGKLESIFTRNDGGVLKIQMIGKRSRIEYGYKHCIYILPGAAKVLEELLDQDLVALKNFIAEQDALRLPESDLVNGFAKILAIIAKVDPVSVDWRDGYRWRYTTNGVNGFQMHKFMHLEDMFAALTKES